MSGDWRLLNKHFEREKECPGRRSNPAQRSPFKVHIGNPPVICEDGIIYGYYEIMDLSSPPLTPAGGQVNWMTKATTPGGPGGLPDCYVLLSMESKNMRNYVQYAIALRED